MSSIAPSDSSRPVVIIGGGLAGLTCAARLVRQRIAVTVLEATDRIGGRVRTDRVDGFTLDHGFQVLLTAYPTCRKYLDYEKLRLRPFEPGALVRYRHAFATLGDPWRRPFQALRTACSPVGTFGDKLRIAMLRRAASKGSLEELYRRPATTTIERLRRDGFSPRFIDHFFRPFLGGVYLDPTLTVSSRMLEFVFRMFACGDIAVPAEGMDAIPRQLAELLPRGTLRLRETVETLSGQTVRLTDGSIVEASSIVVATESCAAARLLGAPDLDTPWFATTTHYFAADQSPDARRMLILAGDETSPDQVDAISTVSVMSDIAPEYAPQNQTLISVSTFRSSGAGADRALPSIVQQLEGWFGASVRNWRHLRTYEVPFALPRMTLDAKPSVQARGGVIVCGDHRETPSIEGAMHSGEIAAELVMETLKQGGNS